jgi:rod shape-determining protein MreC
MPALQRGFLVGRVSRVYSDHSWVDILTSTLLFVPVVIDETRDLGVLTGDGRGGINLLYIPEYKDLRPGMRISTALVSDILPAGIPVGEISEKEPDIEGGFRVYHISPGADMSVLDSLLIMTERGRP